MSKARFLFAVCAALILSSPASARLGFFAVMNSDGSVARGPDVVSTNHIGPGEYSIRFSHSILYCTVTATLGDPGSSNMPGPGTIVTAVRHGSGSSFAVIQTFNPKGTSTDRSFQVNVRC